MYYVFEHNLTTGTIYLVASFRVLNEALDSVIEHTEYNAKHKDLASVEFFIKESD